jgi:type I restriction enzyme S subunit
VLSLVRPYQKSFVKLGEVENVIASTVTGVIDVLPGINPSFIFHQFFSSRFSVFCENRMTGTNYPAITPKDLEVFELVICDEKTMNLLAQRLDQLDESKLEIKANLNNSKSLLKSLINQVF